MVSLDRARKCIGRRIRHTEAEIEGVVQKVGEYDVWVEEPNGGVSACDPENLEWVSTLPLDLKRAAKYGTDYFESIQVRHTSDLYTDDEDVTFRTLGVIYSGPEANDDDEAHPLYVVAHQIKRVWPVRFNADPFGAFELEEYMEWAKP